MENIKITQPDANIEELKAKLVSGEGDLRIATARESKGGIPRIDGYLDGLEKEVEDIREEIKNKEQSLKNQTETEKKGVSVPFMITRDMHQHLADIGYKKEDRDKLTPAQAQEILSKQELANKERTLEVFERKATLEQKGEELERRQKEIEVIRTKIEQKKESSKEQGEKGAERVERSGGEPEDVEDAKNANDVLNTKTEEVVGEVEMSAIDLFEQAQAMEAEQKVSKPVERELRSAIDVVMDRYKTTEESSKTKPHELHAVSDAAMLTNKDLFNLFGTENKNSTETTEKNAEAKKLREELGNARKAVALTEKSDPKYAENQKVYQEKVTAMKNFAYEAKRATLLKKGISETDTEIELGKYAREVLVPNFAVAEAAKIQDEKAEDTMLEKVKDSKVSQFIYGAVDKYRKLPFSKKLMLSAGLFGGALVAGTAGGAIGAVIGGGVGIAKLTQRILGGAGTAVGTEAMIQRSQQKWLVKEGWGKNRKEYVANEIQRLREGVKKGEVKAEKLEEVGGLEDVEKALEERKELEEKFERRRTFLAGAVGFAVGSGAVTQAVKNFGEWTGVKDLIFGAPKEIPGIEKAKEVAGAVKEQAKATVAPMQEKILPIAIGVRGPEGALIDNFRDNPDVAKAFGWDGKSNLSEWAGVKAGELWNADAKEALKNPQILAQMEKLGFSKDADGYAKMAHRIGKGFIQIDPTSKHIKFTDMEYLKNTTKELKTALGVGVGPQAGAAEYQSLSDLAKATEGVTGTEVPAPLQGAQKIMNELVDQKKLSEMEEKMAPHIKELADNMKENGLSPEEIMKYSDEISENAAKLAGIDLSAAKGMINIEALQQIMESPEGKVGGLMQKMVDSKVFTEKDFNSSVDKFGGMNKFMDLKFSDLKGNPVFRSFAEKAYEMYGGSKNVFTFGNLSVRDVMKGIQYERVFGGTAKELMEKIK